MDLLNTAAPMALSCWSCYFLFWWLPIWCKVKIKIKNASTGTDGQVPVISPAGFSFMDHSCLQPMDCRLLLGTCWPFFCQSLHSPELTFLRNWIACPYSSQVFAQMSPSSWYTPQPLPWKLQATDTITYPLLFFSLTAFLALCHTA